MSDLRSAIRVVFFGVLLCAVVASPAVATVPGGDVLKPGSGVMVGGPDGVTSSPDSDSDSGSSGGDADGDEDFDPPADSGGGSGGDSDDSGGYEPNGGEPLNQPEGDDETNASGGFLGLSPGKWLTQALASVAEGFASGAKAFINGVQAGIFGVPAVGDSTDPTTWDAVDGPFWPAVQETFHILQLFALLGVGMVAMRVIATTSGRELHARSADIVLSAIMILVGWQFVQGFLHLSNMVAMGFAPDASQIFATPGNTAKVGLGLVVGAAALVLSSGAALTAFAVVLLERAIILMAVALWPLFWMFRASNGSMSNSVAGIGLGTLAGVVGLKVLQAILASLVFSISWGNVHAVETVGAIIGTVIGTAVTFIALPLIVWQSYIPEVMMMLGTPAISVASDYTDRTTDVAQERAHGAVDKYGEAARGQAHGVVSEARRVPERVSNVDIRGGNTGRVGDTQDVTIQDRPSDPVGDGERYDLRKLDSHFRQRGGSDDRMQN